jgi:hypothetical protein
MPFGLDHFVTDLIARPGCKRLEGAFILRTRERVRKKRKKERKKEGIFYLLLAMYAMYIFFTTADTN